MRKQHIKTEIGYFERKKLIKHGKKDAKYGIVFINNNLLNSPFIEEELSLCIVKIQKEYESFLNIKHDYHEFLANNQLEKSKILLNIKETSNRLEQAQLNLSTLKEKYELIPNLTGENPGMLLGEDSFKGLEREIREFRRIENNAPVEVEKAKYSKRREELLDFIETAPLNIISHKKQLEEFNSLENKQKCRLDTMYQIYITRCKQHYSYTIARISEYWKGVLQIKTKSKDFNFADNQEIYEKLQNNLSIIEEKFKEKKYE